MDKLDITSEYGKYEAIIKDIQDKKIGYLLIKEEISEKIYDEALKIFSTRKAQKVFINKDKFGDFAYQEIIFTHQNKHFPPNKDIKIKELDLENRHAFLEITNEAYYDVEGFISLNEIDILDLIRNKEKAGIISYKKEIIGTFFIKGEIKLFCIKKNRQNNNLGYLSLAKIVNKLDMETKITISSSNIKAINLLKKLDFIETEKKTKWYLKRLG